MNRIHSADNYHSSKMSDIKNYASVHNMYLVNLNKLMSSSHWQNNKKNIFTSFHINHQHTLNHNINIQNNKIHKLHCDNVNKLENIFHKVSFSKKNNRPNIFNYFKNFVYSNNTKNHISWKKAITQQILLSIFNKNNTAEIYVEPRNLGPIYIKIKMQDNTAVVNLTSTNIYVNNVLNSSIESLKKYLIKSGICLSKINIYNSLSSDNIKIEKKYHFDNKNQQKKYFSKNFLKDPLIFKDQTMRPFNYNKIDMYV